MIGSDVVVVVGTVEKDASSSFRPENCRIIK